MAEEQQYCMDLIQQCNAITDHATNENLILESHLETCGTKMASKDPTEREKFIKEILRACNVSQRKDDMKTLISKIRRKPYVILHFILWVT